MAKDPLRKRFDDLYNLVDFTLNEYDDGIHRELVGDGLSKSGYYKDQVISMTYNGYHLSGYLYLRSDPRIANWSIAFKLGFHLEGEDVLCLEYRHRDIPGTGIRWCIDCLINMIKEYFSSMDTSPAEQLPLVPMCANR